MDAAITSKRREVWTWIAAHDEDLRRKAATIGGTRAYDGEDALHDAYLSALDTLQLNGQPYGYLLKKVQWLMIDDHRARGRRVTSYNEDITEAKVDASEQAEAAVALEWVISRIERLPPKGQLVMWLRMAGESQSRIAELTGIPLGTVKNLQRGVMRDLRRAAS